MTPLPTRVAIVLPPAPPLPSGPPIPRLPGGARVTISEIHMINSTRGWAIGGVPGRDQHVLWTRDGGLTWRDVTPPQPRPESGARLAAAGAFLDALTAWVVYFEAEPPPPVGGALALVVWRTQDAGGSWSSSQPVGVEFIGSEFTPPFVRFADPTHGWLLANLGGAGMHRYPVYLLSTADGGQTWQPLIDPYVGPFLQSCYKTDMAFANLLIGLVTIASCPVDGALTFWTFDGGITWEDVFLPSPPEDPDLLEQAACDTHSPQFVVSDQSFVAAECRSFVEEGESFSVLHTAAVSRPYPGGQALFLDPTIGWALGREVHRTTDGGLKWTHLNTLAWDGQFSFVDTLLGWAVARTADESALVRTSDSGASWEILDPVIAGE
jgi:photosystem II stability/assembly factor-like uncharacterized protein